MRMRYGESDPSTPSRFLDDIPTKLTSGTWQQDSRERGRSKATTWDSSSSSVSTWAPPKRTRSSHSGQADGAFQTGDRVRHALFGEGLIVKVDSLGVDQIVTINFEEEGTKRLLTSVANLEKV